MGKSSIIDFGPFLGDPGPNLGAPSFSKLVQNLRLGPPTARSTFFPRSSSRLGPPEPSDRHFGQVGLFLGPGGPKFDKFCVGEVERGPGHHER